MSEKDNKMCNSDNVKNGSYGEYLRKRLKELDITQTELAKAIGKSKKTVSNYCNYEKTTLWDPNTQKQIEDTLQKISEQKHNDNSTYNGYRCMNSGSRNNEFGNFLKDLLSEFQITQEELARGTGTHQSIINQYIKGDLVVSVKQQYDILNFFYCRYNYKYNFSNANYSRFMELMKLLHEDEYEFMINFFEAEEMSDYTDHDFVTRECLDCILKLPVILQDFICDNFTAYFEQTLTNIESTTKDIIATYNERLQQFEIFRQSNKEEQQSLINSLETTVTLSYPEENSEEEYFFDCISAMRRIITSKIPFTSSDILDTMKPLRNVKEQRRFEEKLENIIYNYGVFSTCIEELKLKLNFTKHEWYFWMLLLINVHNGNWYKKDEFV